MYNASLYAVVGQYPLFTENSDVPECLHGMADARIYVEIPADALPDWTTMMGTANGIICEARLLRINNHVATVSVRVGGGDAIYEVQKDVEITNARNMVGAKASYILYDPSHQIPSAWTSTDAVYFDLACLCIKKLAPKLHGKDVLIFDEGGDAPANPRLRFTVVTRPDALTIMVRGGLPRNTERQVPRSMPSLYLRSINGVTGDVSIAGSGACGVSGGRTLTLTVKDDEGDNE